MYKYIKYKFMYETVQDLIEHVVTMNLYAYMNSYMNLYILN